MYIKYREGDLFEITSISCQHYLYVVFYTIICTYYVAAILNMADILDQGKNRMSIYLPN